MVCCDLILLPTWAALGCRVSSARNQEVVLECMVPEAIPVPGLRIQLEVNLKFQARLTIILVFGIFPRERLGKFSVEI